MKLWYINIALLHIKPHNIYYILYISFFYIQIIKLLYEIKDNFMMYLNKYILKLKKVQSFMYWTDGNIYSYKQFCNIFTHNLIFINHILIFLLKNLFKCVRNFIIGWDILGALHASLFFFLFFFLFNTSRSYFPNWVLLQLIFLGNL